jgi:succinate dehydrogenase/fumarate reductase iron-sulfur protein
MAKVYISRFDLHEDREPRLQEYEYELMPGMSVLDVLHLIKEQDGTLAYVYCCRNGHCGLCGLNIDGKPGLSCRTAAYDGMRLEPLGNLPVLRDLIIDRDAYERTRPKLRLFLERRCRENHDPEQVDMEMFERFKVVSRCVECYSCVSVCPVYGKMPHDFAGPAAFVLEARHVYDSRDEEDRLMLLENEGIRSCIGCGLCSQVCDLGAEPYETIRDLIGMINNR